MNAWITKGRGVIGRAMARGAGGANTAKPIDVAKPAKPAETAAPSSPKPAPAPKAAPRELQPIIIPSIPIPRGGGQIVMLAISLGVFWVSVQNTQAALVGPMAGPGASYLWAWAIQIAFSVIERFHFAGNKNWLTRTVLVMDALTNAAGLFLANIAKVSDTPVYHLVAKLPLLDSVLPGSLYDLSDGTRAIIAVALGLALAWGGDKLFDMAGR